MGEVSSQDQATFSTDAQVSEGAGASYFENAGAILPEGAGTAQSEERSLKIIPESELEQHPFAFWQRRKKANFVKWSLRF